MNRSLLFVLALLPGAACAQTPAADRMPDGSHDLYIGLGAQVAPRFEGADRSRTRILPVAQLAWSNGVFIAGASLGWHLAASPTVEYGPLLSWQPGRDADGAGRDIGVVNGFGQLSTARKVDGAGQAMALDGMDRIGGRLLAGGFFNYYFTPDWRMTSSVVGGGGQDRNGVLMRVGLQRVGLASGHHSVTVGANVDIGNRAWNASYSGVTQLEAARSGYAPYEAGAAVRALHLNARWNWSLSPAWLLTSGIDASSLLDVARNSPLTTRPTGVTVSTALAYRF